MEGVAIKKKEKYCGEKKQKRDFRVTAGILILKRERGISSEKKIILKAAIVKVSSEFDEKWTRTSKLSKLWLKNSKKTFRAE